MSVHLDIPFIEAGTLITHLTEFLKGSHGRIQRLTNRKFDLIETILYAKFGFKNTTVNGFQRLRSYFTDNHLRLLKEINEIEFKINTLEISNFNLDNVTRNIHNLIGLDNYIPYEPFLTHDVMKWKQFGEKYISLGAVKTETELRKMISELCAESKNK